MQYVLVICCIILAVAYALFRICQALRNDDNPCATCNGCALKDKNQKNRVCSEKKHTKKFGGTRKKH